MPALPRPLRALPLGVFVLAINANAALTGLTLYRLVCHGLTDLIGLVLLTSLLCAAFVPLTLTEGPRTKAFVRWICRTAGEYFPCRVVVEDEDGLKPNTAYVFGYEPHSALPVGIPTVFATHSPLLPKQLQGNLHGMASSVCFAVPFVRQLWWWLGLRPVSRQLMTGLLAAGKAVVLNPGGIQECMGMQHGSETVFLRKRHGFVRLAIQQGAPLVPVFAFGQSATYSWFRPKPDWLVRWISRKVGAVPLAMWGVWGSPIPHQRPVTVVIGQPIQVPHQAHPAPELVQQYLDRFIHDMAALFERHKAACGQAGCELRIL
uniref:Acyltransferase n=1 Tax=Haematococcus lacustris TaxID=44745 RepID=A0A7G8Z0G4_HAELA|nr:acyl-CoA: diacylglycerol acyltransferase 2D [Haematococcus lacustris]